MQHRDEIILKKIINEIDVGLEIIGNTSLEDFLTNEMMKRAIAMTTINVGELVKSVTNELREQYRNVPWKAAAGMRDITAHKYQPLRMEDVYNTAKIEFVAFKEQLQNILSQNLM